MFTLTIWEEASWERSWKQSSAVQHELHLLEQQRKSLTRLLWWMMQERKSRGRGCRLCRVMFPDPLFDQILSLSQSLMRFSLKQRLIKTLSYSLKGTVHWKMEIESLLTCVSIESRVKFLVHKTFLKCVAAFSCKTSSMIQACRSSEIPHLYEKMLFTPLTKNEIFMVRNGFQLLVCFSCSGERCNIILLWSFRNVSSERLKKTKFTWLSVFLEVSRYCLDSLGSFKLQVNDMATLSWYPLKMILVIIKHHR